MRLCLCLCLSKRLPSGRVAQNRRGKPHAIASAIGQSEHPIGPGRWDSGHPGWAHELASTAVGHPNDCASLESRTLGTASGVGCWEVEVLTKPRTEAGAQCRSGS